MTAGGALMNTTEVENFPGFRDGIMGPALMDEMRAQAERFGAELVPDDVVEVDLTGDVKVVTDGHRHLHRARVILATGSGYRKLGLPSEEELSGRGVSWCATCDGFFFRDQDIAVVGGGDSAVEEATFLTRFGTKVTLIVRRDELRASKIMQERAFADPKLEFVWNTVVEEINGDDRLESVDAARHRDRRDPPSSTRPACSSRSATTRAPSCSTGQVDLDDNGYVLVEHPSTAHQPARRLRRRRPGRPPLPPGDHRGRHRLRRRPRRRALPRRARPRRGHAAAEAQRRASTAEAAHRDRADRRRLTTAVDPRRGREQMSPAVRVD